MKLLGGTPQKMFEAVHHIPKKVIKILTLASLPKRRSLFEMFSKFDEEILYGENRLSNNISLQHQQIYIIYSFWVSYN